VACSSTKSPTNASGTTPAGKAAVSPYNVVVMAPVTAAGAFGVLGQQIVQGMKGAANVLNQQGGILGHQIKIEVLDDAGKTATGISVLQPRLQTSPKPDMVFPGASSSQGLAYVPLAASSGVLSIGTPAASALNDPAKYPLQFQVSPNPVIIGESLMQYFQGVGVKRLGMLYANDAFGQSTFNATKTAAAKAGIDLVTDTYNSTDLDMTAPMQRLQAQKPDQLYFEATNAPVGYVLDSRQKLGWNIPTVGDLDVSVTSLTSTTLIGTPALNGVKVQVLKIQTYTPPAQRPAALSTFLNAVKAIGPITSSISPVSFAYDSLMLAATGAKQANSIDPQAIAHALENLRQPPQPQWVTLATYGYSPQSHAPTVDTSNWTVIAPTHLVDGQYGAPGA
jgi:branched-chain amino acid transport system substrate-binding protein